MNMRLIFAAITLLASIPGHAATAPSQPVTPDLVSELSRDHVDISTRFTGDEITLFGAMSPPGQIIVKVTSPAQPVSLKEKGRVGPFWLSVAKYDVTRTPGLYYLLSSRPVGQLLSPDQQQQHGLALTDAIKGMQVSPKPDKPVKFAVALVNLKRARHQYLVDDHAVRILDGRLFFTSIRLPSQLPLGIYQIDIYLVSHHQVLAVDHRKFRVGEVHLARWISGIANDDPWLFGVSFALMVMVIGLLLGIIMGRGAKKA